MHLFKEDLQDAFEKERGMSERVHGKDNSIMIICSSKDDKASLLPG
jgi:hypothetical protein